MDLGHGGHLIDMLYGIGGRYSEAFYNIGITTVEQLASITDIEGLDELIGIPGRVLRRIRQQALSYLRREIY